MEKFCLKNVKVETDFYQNKSILKLLSFISKIIGRNYFLQVDYKYERGEKVKLKLVDLLDDNKVLTQWWFPPNAYRINLDSIDDNLLLEKTLEYLAQDWKRGLKFSPSPKNVNKVMIPLNCRF